MAKSRPVFHRRTTPGHRGLKAYRTAQLAALGFAALSAEEVRS